MAITSAICNSFKEEILQGGHCLNASGSTPAGNTLKLALYTSSASLDEDTPAFTATAEVPNSGTYAAGESMAPAASQARANMALSDKKKVFETFPDLQDHL